MCVRVLEGASYSQDPGPFQLFHAQSAQSLHIKGSKATPNLCGAQETGVVRRSTLPTPSINLP